MRIILLLIFCVSLTACEELAPDGAEVLDVPFTSQAPEKNWYEPWANACEETSILMVDAFYSEENEIGVQEAKQEILDIFSVKHAELLESKDESLQTIVDLVEALDLNWRGEIVANPSLEDMKVELDAGRPIIVPVYAPQLRNPYYVGGGPDYHVLVLIGYDDTENRFIVNDPGTQFGEKLEFTYTRLMDSIHDLNPSDLDAGEKQVLFTETKLFNTEDDVLDQ